MVLLREIFYPLISGARLVALLFTASSLFFIATANAAGTEGQPSPMLQAGAQASVLWDTGIVGLDFQVPLNRKGYPLIIQVFPGSPAHQVGLKAMDLVTHIDGRSTLGWNRAQLDNAISNQPGAQHQLRVLRAGQLVQRPFPLEVVSLANASSSIKRLYGLSP